MSLRPSRIQRSRKCGQRGRFQPEVEECPSELPRLPVCTEEEDADVGSLDHPSDAPVKLRHLKVAAEDGHLEAMYLLAQECDDRVARVHWLTLAAERGHVRAMHDLGLASVALHERRRWLLRAARQGWAEAMAELGDVECS